MPHTIPVCRRSIGSSKPDVPLRQAPLHQPSQFVYKKYPSVKPREAIPTSCFDRVLYVPPHYSCSHPIVTAWYRRKVADEGIRKQKAKVRRWSDEKVKWCFGWNRGCLFKASHGECSFGSRASDVALCRVSLCCVGKRGGSSSIFGSHPVMKLLSPYE